MPPTLIEATLFGHERGAYTDAKESSVGLIESADGGTLFLDEIAELPADMQAKLLTVLEEHWIRRVGGTRRRNVDFRLICATNRNLSELTAGGTFRRDLYYRCRGLPIHLPPLRSWQSEFRVLVAHLLRQISVEVNGSGHPDPTSITARALEVLAAYSWPGNIRELNHILELAALSANGVTIDAEHIPHDLLREPSPALTASGRDARIDARPRKPRYVAPPQPAAERRNIIAAMQQTGGNRSRAAHRLGMSRQVLWQRIRFYRIEEVEWAELGRTSRHEHGRSDEANSTDGPSPGK